MIKHRLQHRGFALIYAVLFTGLILTMVLIITNSLISNLNLNSATEAQGAAYNLARSGIEEAWYTYRQSIGVAGDGGVATRDDQSYYQRVLPGNACDATNPNAFRVATANNPFSSTNPTIVNLSDTNALNGLFSGNQSGFFDYRVCYNPQNNFIEAIGYYKNYKITLRATINHDADSCTKHYQTINAKREPIDPSGNNSCNIPVPNAIYSNFVTNHSGDTLSQIYQIGPKLGP